MIGPLFHVVEKERWRELRMSGGKKRLEGEMALRRYRGLEPWENDMDPITLQLLIMASSPQLEIRPVHVSPHFPTIQKIRTALLPRDTHFSLFSGTLLLRVSSPFSLYSALLCSISFSSCNLLMPCESSVFLRFLRGQIRI